MILERGGEPPKVTEMLPFRKMPGESGREELDRIQGGDDLTAHQQFLQIVALPEFFIGQDTNPKVIDGGSGGMRFDDCRV